ncbi:carboxylesterase/lipase family protein [Halopseudomonas bauzanensis]|uniref:carboxylesterase/lipase family protein n=1 Tax=Halopseudomonas bauzanensis TaxID=653930 RepID=UPI002555926E|nr:carboxylesterase family protein [Halopseudomonas bauzanensis]
MRKTTSIIPSRFILSTLSAVIMAATLSGCLSGGGGGSSNDGSSSENPLKVTTQQGDYMGIEQDGMRVFRGIRYGVAERFATPVFPPAHADAIQLNETFGSSCPQDASPFGEASLDEDCLFLNVYAPEAPGEYPVMVWIHGGAFIYGSGGASYDPVRLVEQGVVVVTLNYRLGALGFLPHEALGDANFGLQDQQLALEWVQANIDQFDGDPENVTIFGESAGGHSVMSQLASPGAADLFHKAIIQSGSYNGAQVPLEDTPLGPDLNIPGGQSLFGLPTIAETDCSDSPDAQLLECLRGLSVRELLDAQPGNILPVTNTATLPRSINQALASGEFNEVPVMMGSNLDEGALFTLLEVQQGADFTTLAGYRAAVAKLLQEDPRLDAGSIGQHYLDQSIAANSPSPFADAHSAIGTDWRFNCPNNTQWNLLEDQVDTWGYWFTDRDAPSILGPLPISLGAAHSFEIQYVLSSEQTLKERGAGEDQLALAEHMARYWTNFAKYGDDPAIGPNGTDGAAEAVEWPHLTSGGKILRLDAPTPAAVDQSAFGTAHQCAYWENPPQLTLPR